MKKSNSFFYITSIIISIITLYIVFTVSVHSFTINDYGLVNKLPVIYWIGLIAIGSQFYLGKDSLHKSAIALALLITYLFVIPSIVREPVWLSNSYYPYAESLNANDIRTSIDLNQETDISTSYFYWPLYLFLASIINITTYANVNIILKIFPIFTIITISALTYIIFSKKFDSTTSIAGSALVIGSFWLRQQYFGPPAISYIFFFFTLYSITYLLIPPVKYKNSLYILLILFVISTLVTHLLTFVITAFLLGSIFLLGRIKHIENYRQILYITIFTAIISILFYFRGYFLPSGGIPPNYLKWIFDNIINALTNVSGGSIAKESSRIQATLPAMLSYYSSWIIVGLNVICIFYLITSFMLKKFNKNNTLWDNYSLFLIIFLACLGFMAVTLRYGANESYQRAFMFGILPLSYFTLTILSKHKKILYLFIFVIFILNIPAQYGSDNFRTATSTQLSGSKFFSDWTTSNTTTTAINPFSLYTRYFNPDKHFRFSQAGSLPFTSYSSVVNDLQKKLDNNQFLILSNEENNFYNHYLGTNPINTIAINDYTLINSVNNVTEFYTNRIYDNSGFQVIKLYRTYSLTFETIGSGIVSISPNIQNHYAKSSVSIYAIPNEGYKFSGWSGSINSTSQYLKINMDSSKHLVAQFTPAFTILSDDFESTMINRKDLGELLQQPTLNQDIAHSMNNSIRYYVDSSSKNSYSAYNITSNNVSNESYVRGYFYFEEESLKSILNQTQLLRISGRADNTDWRLFNGGLASAGFIKNINGTFNWILLANFARGSIVNSSITVEPNRWYAVELHWSQNTEKGSAEMYVDGTLISHLQFTPINEQTNIFFIDAGIVYASTNTKMSIYVDDIVISKGYIGK